MKIVKRIVLSIVLFIVLRTILSVFAIALMEHKTHKMNNDYSAVFTNDKYQAAVSVDHIEVVTQSVSCGICLWFI